MRLTSVIGPVVDICGSREHVSQRIGWSNLLGWITVEVHSLIGKCCQRCVAMEATEGLRRGQPSISSNSPLSVGVGRCTLGRIFNVLGEPVDDRGEVSPGYLSINT